MHQPYKSDYEYVMESYEHPTNLDFTEKKTILEEQQEIEENLDMLNENKILEVESFLKDIPEKLINRSGNYSEA